MGAREGSEDYEIYFALAVIHSEKFRHYVLPHIKADWLNFWLARNLYEACLRLYHRDRKISFISVIEEIKRDITISDEKVQDICAFLSDKGKNDILLESVIDSALPRVELEIGRNVITQTIIMAQGLVEDGRYDDIFKMFEKAKSQTIYQKPKESNFWAEAEEEANIPWRRGIPLGIHGRVDDLTVEWLDHKLFHLGLPRGALAIFGGIGKGGKTSFLQNIAIYQSLMGYNVDFYSLELDIDYLKARSIGIATNISTNDLRDPDAFNEAKGVLSDLKKRFPDKGQIHYYHYKAQSLTASVIAHNTNFQESMGRKVDSIIIDYVDIMGCERKFREDYQTAAYNTLIVRDLGIEYDCSVITASQLDKEAFGKKVTNRKNVRGAFAKTFTCDMFATIAWEKTKVTDVYNDTREVKHANFYMDANRLGAGDYIIKLEEADLATGRFFDPIPK